MKIFSAAQIREWDAFTMANEPVTSLALMERAADGCARWVIGKYSTATKCVFVCGTGNNGGDGLAMARLLHQHGYACVIYIFGAVEKGSPDFRHNLSESERLGIDIKTVDNVESFPVIGKGCLVIDALFGSGLNRPLETLVTQFIHFLADTGAEVVSIDLPSGMYADTSSKMRDGFPATIIRATYTLTLQSLKLCLVMAENADHFGEVIVIDIGLHPDYIRNNKVVFSLVSQGYAAQFVEKRKPYSHKGNYGHSLLIAGNSGKMGAAILAARACLRSNVGLLTVNVPAIYAPVMYIAIPEAMVVNREEEDYSGNYLDLRIEHVLKKYGTLGIGPGFGTDAGSAKILKQVLQASFLFTVIDADALTILSQNKEWLSMLNAYKILTPHPKEFDRLFGNSENDFARAKRAVEEAAKYHCIIILKGHYTLIAYEGCGYYVNAGNAGMAKGGSGDVLTGILTGISNKGPALAAAIVSVFAHGMAANQGLAKSSDYSLLATDIIEHLGEAFTALLHTPHDQEGI